MSRLIAPCLLAAVTFAILLPSRDAGAVPATMSFTARITTPNGAPVDGGITVTFRILDAATGGQVVWEETQGLVADDGLLYAELGSIDPMNNGLDAGVFDGSVRFLEIRIGNETLSPRLPLVSVPYAIAADHAAVAERLGSLTEDDVVTSVTGGAGITGGGSGGDVTLSVDTGFVQRRITGTCPAGQYMRAVGADGTVSCQADADAGGDITAVTAGAGLTGGGTSGAVTLSVDTSVVQNRVTGTCATGSSIRVINPDGTVTCQADTNAGGDITAVTAGTGLSGGGTSGAVTLSVDTSVIQNRVTGTCAAGSSIRVINPDGTVTCQADTNAGGDITEVTTAANSGLSGGATSGAVTLSIAPSGVTTARIADNAVTMAKTSAPIGMFSGSGTLQTSGTWTRILGGGFTADSNGSCFVTAKATIVRQSGGSATTFLLLYVAVNENGAALALQDQHVTYSAPPASVLVPATIPVYDHYYQAQATYVVPVVSGRSYTVGCATTQVDGQALPAGLNVACQASYVCQ